MLASMLMLGLQLCLPLSVQATVLSVDVIGLGVKDPTDKPGLQPDLDLPPHQVARVLPPVRSVVPGGGCPRRERASLPPVLPVCGYHPSAP